MLNEEEVKALVKSITSKVLNADYEQAVNCLKSIYDKHLEDQPKEQQIATLEEFIKIIRNNYGYTGRKLAQAGIATAELLIRSPNDENLQQLKLLLDIGRCILNDAPNSERLLEILLQRFTPLAKASAVSALCRPSLA